MNASISLVAHDFSSCAAAAADVAIADLLDSRRGGRIVLLHVFTVNLPGAPIEGALLASGFLHLEEAARVEVTRVLERIAEQLRAAAGPINIEIVARMGTPAEAILEEADACGATRIVLGTHGRTGVKHMLLGSVAERVMRRAKVPVLVAHSPTKQEIES